ncbi:hypothetical protein RZS28_12990 [Methylocapsa polymorpha]|uniref:Uncharacterized protein n=1 Tax=Methylocapsa polymorpha TaxID=3080828 RepID=A0ABZ0HS26_9HYPH|nr:hypothetical protein RZS28_12990 [Methylocapsa sp. RX1]
MAADETPEVTLVPVKKYEINVTLEDILTPLTQISSRPIEAGETGVHPELAGHLQRLSELASQLKEVVGAVNRIHPTLLAPQAQRKPPGD